MKPSSGGYPGDDPGLARKIQDMISVVAGEKLPRRIREPEKFARRLRMQEGWQ